MALSPRIGVSTSTVFGGHPREDAFGRSALTEVARTGAALLELAIDEAAHSLDRLTAGTVAAALERTGLRVSGLVLTQLAAINPASQSADTRGRALRMIRRGCRLASDLDADYVVVIPGLQERNVLYDETLDAAAQTLGQAARYAEDDGLSLLVENAALGFLESPLELRTLVDRIDSHSVGICLDLGNVLAAGQPYPANWIRQLGDRISVIHAHDFGVAGERGPRPCGRGDVPWRECFQALDEIGFSGPLIVESPPAHGAVTVEAGLAAAAAGVGFLAEQLSNPAVEEAQR